jgi:hypothetical protein
MTDPIVAFFAGYPPDIQAISGALRAMIRATIPDAVEIPVLHQNHVSYALMPSPGTTIVYICPLQTYVRLGFMYGGHLPDPEHLLEGTGKRLRHHKVRTLTAAQNPAFADLVRAGWVAALTHLKQ